MKNTEQPRVLVVGLSEHAYNNLKQGLEDSLTLVLTNSAEECLQEIIQKRSSNTPYSGVIAGYLGYHKTLDKTIRPTQPIIRTPKIIPFFETVEKLGIEKRIFIDDDHGRINVPSATDVVNKWELGDKVYRDGYNKIKALFSRNT